MGRYDPRNPYRVINSTGTFDKICAANVRTMIQYCFRGPVQSFPSEWSLPFTALRNREQPFGNLTAEGDFSKSRGRQITYSSPETFGEKRQEPRTVGTNNERRTHFARYERSIALHVRRPITDKHAMSWLITAEQRSEYQSENYFFPIPRQSKLRTKKISMTASQGRSSTQRTQKDRLLLRLPKKFPTVQTRLSAPILPTIPNHRAVGILLMVNIQAPRPQLKKNGREFKFFQPQ